MGRFVKKGRGRMGVCEVALLLEAFFEGRSSAGDERRLYDYFGGDDVDELFRNYVPMFRGLGEAVAVREGKGGAVRWWWMGSVAAMLAVVAFVGMDFLRTPAVPVRLADLYEGSYVIERGRRIDDVNVIMPRLHRAEMFSVPSGVVYKPEISTAGLDAGMRERINDILNY